tara:strand:- start:555 stop:872 length:318 start_codon:yes stop_codon:yes gene_type:complete
VLKPLVLILNRIHNDINLEIDVYVMQRKNFDENGAFPVVNFIGIILGFASLSTLLIVQSLTFLLPLLFAPMVCVTLLYVLYVANNNNTTSNEETISVNPVRVDVL